MLKSTGERFLPFSEPKEVGAEIHYEHLHRYALATQLSKNMEVLDLASGEGYGSFMLSKTAKHVIGVDFDKEAIAHASSKYPCENLEFLMGSIMDIPIDGEKIFDVIVCFEAIEHVEDHRKLLSEVKRLLKENGLFIVSTPNKLLYSNEDNYYNPFHVKELYFDQFRELLSEYFSNLQIYGQRIYSCSNIWRLSPSTDCAYKEFQVDWADDGFAFKTPREKKSRYFIAVASDGNITETVNTSNLIDVSDMKARLDSDQIDEFETMCSNYKETLDIIGSLYVESLVQMARSKKTSSEAEEVISAKTAEVAALQNRISEMERSVLWNLTTKYQNTVVDRILPMRTGRRSLYDRTLESIRTLANEGPGSFSRKAEGATKEVNEVPSDFNQETGETKNSRWNLLNEDRNIADTTILKDGFAARSTESKDELINKKVSIIIPTKNAGQDFELTMEKLRSQKGVADIEIIVIDSGSTDDTIQLASRYGAKILNIKPQDFCHGTTRNQAAEKATGEYILFMVQDALPIGERWLCNMVKAMEEDDSIGAATCRQVPKSDADLFATFSLWSHYRNLQFDRDKTASQEHLASAADPYEVRRLAALENTCTIFRKDVFDELRFSNLCFAEDLDMGVRLLKKGYKISFLYSCGIIHSHNREPAYWLKRYYVDCKWLPTVIPGFINTISDKDDIIDTISGMFALYCALNASIANLRSTDIIEDTGYMMIQLKAWIWENLGKNTHNLGYFEQGDKSLDDLFNKINGQVGIHDVRPDNKLVKYYFNILNIFRDFLILNQFEGIDEEDFINSLYKLFAGASGLNIANCYLLLSKSIAQDDPMLKLDNMLSGGI